MPNLSKDTVKDRSNLFNNAWRKLADDGVCDALGGREYCRVVREYIIYGMPVNVIEFITHFANLPSRDADRRQRRPRR